MRLLVCALLLCCLTACARREPAVVRATFPDRPVTVWIDSAWMRGELAEATQAALVMQELRDAGVTSVGFEAIDWQGASTESIRAPLRSIAESAGLEVAAILPCFTPRADDPPEALSQYARWTGDAWSVEAMVPSRLSPVHPIGQQRLLDQLAGLTESTVILAGFGFEDSTADVGPAARLEFERWSAFANRSWPDDVLGVAPTRLPWGPEGRGPRWEAWTTWRADVLSKLLFRVRTSMPGNARLVLLVDAPFQVHQRMGVNWAAPTPQMLADHPWLPREYAATSVSHLLDAVALGFWAPELVRRTDAIESDHAWWASIEGSASASTRLVVPGTRLWTAVPVDGDGWDKRIAAARSPGGGVLIIGLAGKIRGARDWARLAEALR